MKRFKIMMAAASILCFAFTGCSSDDDPNPKPHIERQDIEMTESEAQIVEGQKAFAFDFFGRIAGENGNNNVMTSPLSAYTALSMLANGSEGEMNDELLGGLGATDIEALNALNSRLRSEFLIADAKVVIKMANSIWCNPAFSLLPEFTNTLSNSYNAQSFAVSLRNDAGVAQFNAWCSQATDGIINKMLESPSESDLTISNATTFKGEWQKKFSEDETAKGWFEGPDIRQRIDFMHILDGFSFWYSPKAIAVRLPYGNGAFRMTILLPKDNTPINDFAATYTLDDWNDGTEHIMDVDVKLPKFNIKTSRNLLTMFREWMPNAFGRAYTKISNSELAVSNIVQSVAVEVNESGTEAAVVTDVCLDPTEPGGEFFHANRPFMFVIDEVSTGAILFIGTVNTIEQ